MPAPDSRAAQLFRRCETVLLATVLVAAAAAVQFAVGEARIPYELDYEEGNVLNAGLLIAQGATPYPDLQRLAVLNAYTPFFYVVVAHVIEHEGVQFTAPRMVCLLLGILAAVLVGALSWRFTNDVRRAVMFGCLYLTLPTVQYWLPLLRVDWLGLALALAGLGIVAFGPRYWYAAALLFVAALFSKQTFAAAPAAGFAWLLWTRRWKAAAGLAALMAALSALVFWSWQTRTHGQFAWHMLHDHPQPFSLRQFAAVIGLALPLPGTPFWRLALFILPLNLMVLLLAWEMIRRTNWREFPLPRLYLAFSAAVPLITIPKGGSATNHLLEFFAAACVCASVGYTRIGEAAAARKWMAALPLVLALLTAGLAVAWRFPQLNQPSTALLRDCGRAYAYVKEHVGERVLAENLGAVVLAGKPVLVSPYLLKQLVQYSGWPDATLTSSIREDRFDAILLADTATSMLPQGSEAWSAEALQAIDERYQLKARFACRYATAAYEPRRERPQGISSRGAARSQSQREAPRN
jgi:hypothetical protein